MENVGIYSFEEYIHLVKSFHGSVAPGMLIGGFMVQCAKNHMPEDVLYDVICETPSCLPDAVQLLTPCTVGNGWLKIVNLGRYALSLYDKYSGDGIRVALDAAKMDRWPETRHWFLKVKAKNKQDSQAILNEVKDAGFRILTLHRVTILPVYMEKHNKGRIALCPLCGEAYPEKDGAACRGCSERIPYGTQERVAEDGDGGSPAVIPEHGAGHVRANGGISLR